MSYSFSSQFLSIGRIFIATCAGLLIAVGLQYAAAWTEPTTAPPNSNVGAPITTGPQAQTKSGTISINAWDSQYLAGYDDRANKRSIGGAYGWDNEVLYINGWNDWAGGVSIGGNAYVDGTINVEDVYIRSVGKWASELESESSGIPALYTREEEKTRLYEFGETGTLSVTASCDSGDSMEDGWCAVTVVDEDNSGGVDLSSTRGVPSGEGFMCSIDIDTGVHHKFADDERIVTITSYVRCYDDN